MLSSIDFTLTLLSACSSWGFGKARTTRSGCSAVIASTLGVNESTCSSAAAAFGQSENLSPASSCPPAPIAYRSSTCAADNETIFDGGDSNVIVAPVPSFSLRGKAEASGVVARYVALQSKATSALADVDDCVRTAVCVAPPLLLLSPHPTIITIAAKNSGSTHHRVYFIDAPPGHVATNRGGTAAPETERPRLGWQGLRVCRAGPAPFLEGWLAGTQP